MKEPEEHRRAWREVGGWALAVFASIVIVLFFLAALSAWKDIITGCASMGEAEQTITIK